MQPDFSRLRPGELIAGIGGIALFGFMFLDWFSGPVGLPTGVSGQFAISSPGFDAWQALDDTNLVLLLTSRPAVKEAGLRAAGLKIKRPACPMPVVTSLVAAVARASDLPSGRSSSRASVVSPEIGIFLGLAATIAVSIGGYLAAKEDGTEMLVPID